VKNAQRRALANPKGPSGEKGSTETAFSQKGERKSSPIPRFGVPEKSLVEPHVYVKGGQRVATGETVLFSGSQSQGPILPRQKTGPRGFEERVLKLKTGAPLAAVHLQNERGSNSLLGISKKNEEKKQ